MKKYIFFFITLTLALCSACVTELSKPLAPGLFIPNYNSFPPGEKEFVSAMTEAGIDWTVISIPEHLKINDPESLFYAIHIIDSSNQFTCSFNMRNYIDKSMDLLFVYNGQNAEDYNRFQQAEWPLFWMLTGELLEAHEEVAGLGKECMDYFNEYSASFYGGQSDYLIWQGRAGDIHCNVLFRQHHFLDQFVLESMEFNYQNVYLDELNTTVRQRADSSYNGAYIWELNTASGIYLNSHDTGEVDFFVLKGYLEQIQRYDNDDPVLNNAFYSPLDFPILPMNTHLYLKALLVDETGVLPVYITPTSLTEAELSEERLHFINIIYTPEPLYIIDLSTNNLNSWWRKPINH